MSFLSNLFRATICFLLFVIFSPVFFSCNKPTLVGKNILPSGDEISTNQTDTLTLITTTVREDSVRTDNFNYYVFGTSNDNIFGKFYSNIYTQAVLPSEGGINLKGDDSLSNLYLDSAVLTLGYSGFYGDKNFKQTAVVYELSVSMDASAEYYSNKKFSLGNEIGRVENFLPNTTDSIEIYGTKYVPHLRIKLSDAKGDSLLQQSGTVNFQSNTDFLNYFKGICIATDPFSQGKGVMYFNLNASISKLTLYYHTDSTDSLTFSFNIGSGASSNYFSHNFSSSQVEPFLNNPNPNGDSIVFIQPLAGVKTKITIPYLQNLGKILINKAELIITEPNPDTVFTSPSKIVCARADSTGKNLLTQDQVYELFESGYFGGAKISNSNGTNEYRFNLALHLQSMVNDGSNDYGLFLIPKTQDLSNLANRLIMAGSAHSSYKMKINLAYSKL